MHPAIKSVRSYIERLCGVDVVAVPFRAHLSMMPARAAIDVPWRARTVGKVDEFRLARLWKLADASYPPTYLHQTTQSLLVGVGVASV
jgi:hypothetical protein